MFEQWLPLGPIGIITAFNFPNAVWGWNAMLGAVCGDVCIWKPSLLTPLITLATHRIAERVAARMNHPGVFRLLIGTDDQVGERLVNDRRVPLISDRLVPHGTARGLGGGAASGASSCSSSAATTR